MSWKAWYALVVYGGLIYKTVLIVSRKKQFLKSFIQTVCNEQSPH